MMDHLPPASALSSEDLRAGMMALCGQPLPRTIQWHAHPEVVAKAAELGITVDELVRRAVEAIDARED